MSKLTRNSWVKITLIVLLCLTICGAFASCSTGCWRCDDAWDDDFDVPTETFGTSTLSSDATTNENRVDAANAHNLTINWAAGHVTVRTAPDAETNSQVVLKEADSGSAKHTAPMKVSSQGDTLTIDYTPQIRWMGCSSFKGKRLEVVLPESMAAHLGKVCINGASGNYELSGFTCEGLAVDLASGTMESKDVSAAALSVDMASGQSHFQGNFTQTVDLALASGYIEVANTGSAFPAVIDADVISGNVDLIMPNEAGFTVDVDRMAGNFNCGYPVTATADGSHQIHGDGKSKVNISLTSGKVNLSPQESR